MLYVLCNIFYADDALQSFIYFDSRQCEFVCVLSSVLRLAAHGFIL